MNKFQYFRAMVELMDMTLSTRRKRHLVGGTLLGVSLMFGALAVTVMTTQMDEPYKKEEFAYEDLYQEPEFDVSD